ncbi:related to nitrate reductase [Cephalotrichum gorgonifer]|uniref:Nitrate reductase [NADPH] n=1 Tax=Cephalotrichum gorgonifer TaxID=2041049 RepID=A0AAE8N688_9PEZI|nr:related to nitrate reductase [Cephalotrichum gorgonifer]
MPANDRACALLRRGGNLHIWTGWSPRTSFTHLINTTSRRRRYHSTSTPTGPANHVQTTWNNKWRRNPKLANQGAIAAGSILSILALTFFFSTPVRADHAPQENSETGVDRRDPSLPRFRISEIKKHDGDSSSPWVTYEDKVYDITDWVPAHPGGEVILRAAGGSVDPYWNIFVIHKEPYIREILESYLIGFVDIADLVDGKIPQDEIEDPFMSDPPRHPGLITLTSKPRNAETPGDALADHFITPTDQFYVRNHMWVPKVEGSGANHVVTIELPDGETKTYTLAELREKFPAYKVTATLQCSGNRRKHMTAEGLRTNGLQWNVGGISSAEWEGVRLADVLADAGFPVQRARDGEDTDAKHVWFSGLEAYGSSIPLETAVDPRADVLLAYGMNGAPLPRDHGFPLRALVPGTVAARSVKWLSKIVLSEEESPAQWQRKDYKCFGPNEAGKEDWEEAPAIQEMPVTSAISSVKVQGGETEKSSATVQGYAFSGGGRKIVRVDISLDNGRTWDQASLVDDCEPGEGETESRCKGRKSWAWQRWRYEGELPLNEVRKGKRCSTVVVKATDEAYNSQPEWNAGIYNLRGNLATAWHRVVVCGGECTSKKA